MSRAGGQAIMHASVPNDKLYIFYFAECTQKVSCVVRCLRMWVLMEHSRGGQTSNIQENIPISSLKNNSGWGERIYANLCSDADAKMLLFALHCEVCRYTGASFGGLVAVAKCVCHHCVRACVCVVQCPSDAILMQ